MVFQVCLGSRLLTRGAVSKPLCFRGFLPRQTSAKGIVMMNNKPCLHVEARGDSSSGGHIGREAPNSAIFESARCYNIIMMDPQESQRHTRHHLVPIRSPHSKVGQPTLHSDWTTNNSLCTETNIHRDGTGRYIFNLSLSMII